MSASNWLRFFTLVGLLFVAVTAQAQIPAQWWMANQGFSMKLRYCNLGAFGRAACPPVLPGDSAWCGINDRGLVYPAGSGNEHLAGAGLWIGGRLDTAASGTSTPVRLVSVSYEGWAGPFYEFSPDDSAADSIWCVPGQSAPKPPGWDQYWSNDLPYRPFSDNNQYCRYTDTSFHNPQHTPLQLKVVHSSYVWADPFADGIHVVEFRLSNIGIRAIDSVYIGLMVEPMFTYGLSDPQRLNYMASEHIAYCTSQVESVSTPFGFTFISLPLPEDSARWTFATFEGPNTPPDDRAKYTLLSSGLILPDPWPSLWDGRVLLAVGPFALQPSVGGQTHPLTFAIAFLGAPDTSGLVLRAQRAKVLYLQGTGATQNPDDVPVGSVLIQSFPNPFNSSTTIQYALPTAGSVSLAIHSMLGQEISRLVDALQPAGTHRVRWNASGLASGVYYCQLRCGSVVQTKRLILLK